MSDARSPARQTVVKPTPVLSQARAPLMQRKCACGGTPGPSGECEECRKKRLLQRSATRASTPSVSPLVSEVLRSPGSPLDAGTRSYMEPRFGQDFGQVRVHTDNRAAESARSVDAHAYTVGQDIVFDSGKYDPSSSAGRHLLAHELAHTVQQRGLQRSTAGIHLPSSAEDQRLEHEAETAAAMVTSGGTSAIPCGSATRPILSRATKKKKGVSVKTDTFGTDHFVEPDDEYATGKKTLQSYTVDVLTLPATKGPRALAIYQALAKAQGLAATLEVTNKSTKAALWQERAVTDDLRDRWLARMGWPPGVDADALWHEAGGDDVFPRVGGKTCQMDHIVELQIGGNNTNENIQPLDAAQNSTSGGSIKGQVFQLAERVLDNAELSDPADPPDQVTLRFKGVKLDGTPEQPVPKKNCPPSAATCLGVECCAAFVKVPEGKRPAKTTEPYQIRSGGAATTLQVPDGLAKSKKKQDCKIRENPINEAAAELIPGMLLKTLHHTEDHDTISATIDDREKSKTRLPITLDNPNAEPVTFSVAKTTGLLKIKGKADAGIKFQYPFLSPGEITKLSYDDNRGLEFRGFITPKRIPFLKRLDVAYEGGVFKLTKDLNEKTLKSPIPNTRITKAELALELWPELKPSGTLAFAGGPPKKELFTAQLEVFKDAQGLAAKGTLNVNIPGVDKAEGIVNYSGGEFSGGITITSTKIKEKFKYIRSGEVTITFANGNLTATGLMTLDLPYTDGVTAKLMREDDRWVFEGDGVISPPKLGKVGIGVRYDGTNFSGRVSPGPKFDLLGFHGGLETLTYRNGRFGGKGSLEFKKGRAAGKLTVELLESGKFAGRGDITYQINDNLVVTGTAELDKHEKLHLTGTLRYTKPIELPRTSFSGNKSLFQAGISIPIPGLSLGPAGGLKARIEGELTAGFKVGPAQIRNVEITAAFNPLEDDPNLEVVGGAEFHMPASAYIGGNISASIMLDLLIGDVSGGLTVRVRADLDGGFKATVKAMYSLKGYSVSADFELMMALILVFGIDAFLKARAGWGPFSVSTEKRWKLAEKKVDSGLKFGIRAPLKYASYEPFQAPSWDSIEFIKPKIDFGDLLDRVISATPPEEKKES